MSCEVAQAIVDVTEHHDLQGDIVILALNNHAMKELATVFKDHADKRLAEPAERSMAVALQSVPWGVVMERGAC